jgi:rRNA maturation RNase YbeY
MITFNYETPFSIKNETMISNWIHSIISQHRFELGEINYIFCDDAYLLKLNIEFLQHDTLTDIISFDTTLGKLIGGDVFISIERIKENAITFAVPFEEELHRVMIHGVLHFLGFKDKTTKEKTAMRNKEEESLSLLNS